MYGRNKLQLYTYFMIVFLTQWFMAQKSIHGCYKKYGMDGTTCSYRKYLSEVCYLYSTSFYKGSTLTSTILHISQGACTHIFSIVAISSNEVSCMQRHRKTRKINISLDSCTMILILLLEENHINIFQNHVLF